MSNRIEDLIEKARHYENLWHEALDDNKRLKIEADLLEGRVRYWRIEAECDHGRWLRCLEDLDNLRKNADISPSQSPHEIERLNAKVEMLQGAGDRLAEHLDYKDFPFSLEAWQAAKEGKPSV